MLIGIIHILIILFLLYGCYTDIKTRHVSNKISYSIAAMAIVLIDLGLWEYKIIFILALFYSYKIKLLGSADLIILAPLTFMLTSIQFVIFLFLFLVLSVSIGIFIKNKYRIPGYVPITISMMIIFYLSLCFEEFYRYL
jgi:Flp pilus assembly protein protease CpaA